MSERIDRVLSYLLTATALFFAGVLAKREFVDPDPRSVTAAREGVTIERVSNWDELLANGLPLWSPTAPVIVAEFADLECPACRRFHTRLQQTAADLQVDVGLVMLHYPLSTHRFARPAARALECAYSLGAGPRFVDVAYAKQDSLGLKSWISYAQEAGVQDTVSFAECVGSTGRVERVERGRGLGESMNVHATPTVIINGWRFSSVPNDAQLRGAIKALVRGQPPPGV